MFEEDDSIADFLPDGAYTPFVYNKKPFTYPQKSIHIEVDFLGGQSWAEMDIPVQDVTLCVGKPKILALGFCIQPGDLTLLYL